MRNATHPARFQSLTGRLKTDDARARVAVAPEFQSLTGRLKTTLIEWRLVAEELFQSLTGRLKTYLVALGDNTRIGVSIPHR